MRGWLERLDGHTDEAKVAALNYSHILHNADTANPAALLLAATASATTEAAVLGGLRLLSQGASCAACLARSLCSPALETLTPALAWSLVSLGVFEWLNKILLFRPHRPESDVRARTHTYVTQYTQHTTAQLTGRRLCALHSSFSSCSPGRCKSRRGTCCPHYRHSTARSGTHCVLRHLSSESHRSALEKLSNGVDPVLCLRFLNAANMLLSKAADSPSGTPAHQLAAPLTLLYSDLSVA